MKITTKVGVSIDKTETKLGWHLPLTKYASKICLYPVVKDSDKYTRLNECILGIDWIVKTHDTKYGIDISYIDIDKMRNDLSKYYEVNNKISGFVIQINYQDIPMPFNVPLTQKYVSDDYVGYIAIATVNENKIEKFFIPNNSNVDHSEYFIFGKKGIHAGILSPYKPIFGNKSYPWITNKDVNKFMQRHQELFNNL